MDNTNGILAYIVGPGLIPQILLTVMVLLVFFIIISVIETVVDSFKKFDRQSAMLMPDTTNAQHMVLQKKDSGVPIAYPSSNEVNGMEFSYSMYIFINPETFETTTTTTCGGTTTQDTTRLKHIFHKGDRKGWPLLGPGLFCHGNANTLRLYMNSSTSISTYVEIPNIPVGKWFHLVIILKGKYLDVYVNGNVVQRKELTTVPKPNYGNIYIMTPMRYPTNTQETAQANGFSVDGAMKGMVSRLKYYSYALTYSQIDGLYREGPSKKLISASYTETPPYFHDDWWVTRFSS